MDLLNKLGLSEELERSSLKRQNTGNARRRGRPFKTRKGPLFVVSKPCALLKSAVNVPGVDVVSVESLNAELLAPGTDYGRLTLYTKSAIETLEKTNMFTESFVSKEKTAKKTEVKAPAEKKKTAEQKPVKVVKKVAKKKETDKK